MGMQLGPSQYERNALEDTKRLVEQLKKNGTVDQLHSRAVHALFECESFKSEVRQWMQSRPKPSNSHEDLDTLQEMALSALSGLLAGTLQVEQELPAAAAPDAAAGSGPKAAAAAAAASKGSLLQQHKRQQQLSSGLQQQHRQGPGQRPFAQQQQQQQQQQDRTVQRSLLVQRQQQQKQQQQETPIAEDVAIRLKCALLNMLESEEAMLQTRFRECYREHKSRLEFYRPTTPPEFTSAAPKDTSESPHSPKRLYQAVELEQQQQQQQQPQAQRQEHEQEQQQSSGFSQQQQQQQQQAPPPPLQQQQLQQP